MKTEANGVFIPAWLLNCPASDRSKIVYGALAHPCIGTRCRGGKKIVLEDQDGRTLKDLTGLDMPAIRCEIDNLLGYALIAKSKKYRCQGGRGLIFQFTFHPWIRVVGELSQPPTDKIWGKMERLIPDEEIH